MRKGYEKYYQRNYGQLGLAEPLFYLLTTPFNVATSVGVTLDVWSNQFLNIAVGLVGVPAQVILDIVTGQGLGGKQSPFEE